MATARLYYTDCYLKTFTAQTTGLEAGGLRVYLDRSAFYPTSGGQLFDTGVLGDARVVEVVDEGDRVAHVLSEPVTEGPLTGRIDWARRFRFMQQHTGQHLLSAVFHERFGVETVAVHLGEEYATVELAVESLGEETIRSAELEANAIITENRRVEITFSEAVNVEGLRKASDRDGLLRIVSIEGLDKSACGGTHVRGTGEIGCLLIRKPEKIRGNVRLEFLCGDSAIRRARLDYDLLNATARTLSCALDEVPGSVAAAQETVKQAAKENRRMASELAAWKGRELFAQAPEDADGLRRCWLRTTTVDDATRATAQAFVAMGHAVFLATDASAVLLAASPDAGMHCGNRLKAALTAAGGRGGGGASLAQGSVPGAEAIASLAQSLGFMAERASSSHS
jgi:alanyl-tRNA synthetase